MSKSGARKDAAKTLGFNLSARYQKLVDAQGDDEIQTASIDLGLLFNQNLDFIIWCLKEYGGVVQMPFTPKTKPKTAPIGDPPDGTPVDALPVLPEFLAAKTTTLEIPCQCPPQEPGIIGPKHMASCPLAYQDA